MDGDALGEKMSENVRKRVSKWDVVADTGFSAVTTQNNDDSVDAADAHHDEDLTAGSNISKSVASNTSKQSDMGIEHTMRSKDSSSWLHWKRKDDNANGDVDQCYGASTTPRVDAWRQRSRSCSRSRSRSQSHSRSRSRSRSPRNGWGRSRRNRSRSPHGFRHEGEGWAERVKIGSTLPCRDFAVGRCRRGSQCRFLHQEGRDYDCRAHVDSGPSENRGRRQERGWSSRYSADETFTDEPSGYSRDKFSQSYEGHSDGDHEKYELRRNNRPAARCNDFFKGKCYRGSGCRYVHDGANVDGYGRVHNRREDVPYGHDQRRESHRTSDISCKYFLDGRCRNGDRCKFSHQNHGGHDSPQGKHPDGRWGEDAVMGNRSWESSKWSGNPGAGAAYPQHQSSNDPKWGDEARDRNLPNNQFQNDPKQDIREADTCVSIAGWFGDSLCPRGETNCSSSPHWKSNDNCRRGGISESRTVDQICGIEDMASAGVSRDDNSQSMLQLEPVCNGRDSHLHNPQADGEQQVSVSNMQPSTVEKAFAEQHAVLKANASSFPCEDQNNIIDALRETNAMGNKLPIMSPMREQYPVKNRQHELMFPPHAPISQGSNSSEHSQQMAFPPDLQNFNQGFQSQLVIPHPPSVQNFNSSGQSLWIIYPFLSGQNVNLNGHSQEIASLPSRGQSVLISESQQEIMQPPSKLRSQALLDQGGLSEKLGSLGANASQISLGSPVPQNTVTTEKGSRLTNLSASLAQIFGDGQQLPKLYATLNRLSATGMVPSQSYSQSDPTGSSAAANAPLIHSDKGHQPHNQYRPVQGGVESIKPDTSNEPSTLPANACKQNGNSIQELQASQDTLGSSCIAARSPGICGSEKLSYENLDSQCGLHTDTGVAQVAEVAPAQLLNNEETGHVKDMDADYRVDEETKREKDAKGMRMFKFALVEFVKELLKPTWKEGHMSKEVHKTIVKKVVDKVTSTMQSAHVPQTQEKIDHYLSCSKPKLTKLVHAYVEKYLRT